jgi:hypothetical protein
VKPNIRNINVPNATDYMIKLFDKLTRNINIMQQIHLLHKNLEKTMMSITNFCVFGTCIPNRIIGYSLILILNYPKDTSKSFSAKQIAIG